MALCLIACAAPLHAQQGPSELRAERQAEANRPRVCLVLSGGGARGAAHIGVLKVLEEMRIPIDCITGTSMGAVVGAAYASGMSIAEMEKLAGAITVDALFKEKPPRRENSIRRKQDDFRNLFGVEIGVADDGTMQFAKGVVSGVQLETLLRRLSRIKGSIDFDLLPIPFRAVATDLVTGAPKVFANGDLALAMRASMSVPGIIAPAEFDGMMLVDGGLVDNLPVGVARSLGADIVIAVNLGTPLMTRKEIRDVLGITGQMIAILTEQNVQQTLASLKPTDILVLPELGNFSAADFDRLPETYPIGEAAARKVADRLAPLAVSPAIYASWQRERTAPLVADRRPVDAITFDPPSRVASAYAESLMATRPGEPLDQTRLDADLLRLYGTGDFEHVSYRLVDSPARRILNVEAVAKSWGPNYLRFGLGLSSDFQGNAFFNLLGQYRRTWVNELGGEWRTDVAFGRNSEISTEFYQPLDATHRFFVAPRATYQRGYLQVFEDKSKVAEYAFPTFLAGIDVGSGFTRYGEVRFGTFWGVTRNDLLSGQPLLGDENNTRLAGIRALAYFDQLDSVYFPKDGWMAKGELLRGLKGLGSDLSYDRWDVEGVAALTRGRHTLQFGLRGAGPISGSDTPGYLAMPWGGFLQQSGFATGQLLNERFVFGRVAYMYKLMDVPLLEGLYAGVSGEVGHYGSAVIEGNPTGTLYSGAAFLALDSPIGPIYLGYGVGSGSNRSAYFFLGRP